MQALVLSGEVDAIANFVSRQLKVSTNSIAVIPLRTSFEVVPLTKDGTKKIKEKPEIKSLNYNNFLLKKVTL